jgi:UDP-N-acetyl-D-mannosaminuronic acid transferase (WecB/TagA/CpsF family)
MIVRVSPRFVELFGIRFLDGDFEDAKVLLDRGGVMVVPSGPGLATIDRDSDYYQALKASDLALFDSGLLVLLLRVFKRTRVRKLSGLLFLREFLAALQTQPDSWLFLVDPNTQDSEINRAFLDSQGIRVPDPDHYVAPMYGDEVVDAELVRRLEQSRPDYVLINIGGGVQEKLAHYLQRELSFRPGIICTGAAIAFLTGRQAGIPGIADRLSLGWLVRCISSPRQFIPRYWAALRLIPVFFRYADKPPASLYRG